MGEEMYRFERGGNERQGASKIDMVGSIKERYGETWFETEVVTDRCVWRRKISGVR